MAQYIEKLILRRLEDRCFFGILMILIAHQKRKGPSLAKVDACRLEFVKQCGSIAGPCLAYDIYNILLQGPTLLGQSMFSSVLVY